MNEEFKSCKQCGRTLQLVDFRKTKSRSKGIYKSTTGHSAMCKSCESLNSRAYAAIKKRENGQFVDTTDIENYLNALIKNGHQPVNKYARMLVGLEPMQHGGAATSLQRQTELLEFCDKVRRRDFETFDEADEQFRAIEQELKSVGMYAEVSDLMDEWFDED